MAGSSLEPEVLEPLAPYRSSKSKEWPNSGYLGGRHIGGPAVERLANKWSRTFKVRHSIPCNSATSGLLAACMAARVGPGTTVLTTPFSMSATAACAKVLGADVRFVDIEGVRYGINPRILDGYILDTSKKPQAIIVANILGHPAHLIQIKHWCEVNGVVMIEDNAQSPLATECGVFTGTVGHIGVFSLNIHKHFQCGEGGIVVTNNDTVATWVYDAINHGELRDDYISIPGLNLRMTENTARLAWSQLIKAPELVKGRRDLARRLSDQYTDEWIMMPPKEDTGCISSFYIWAGRMKPQFSHLRDKFMSHLRAKNAPLKAGYSPLLTEIFKSDDYCPVARAVEDELVTFETCAWEPRPDQISRLGDIIKWASMETINGSVKKSA